MLETLIFLKKSFVVIIIFMKFKKIFVTGGAGYVSSKLICQCF